MATITTKYSVGDVVYRAGTTTEARQHPCPDCLGSRKWEAKSPAGGTFTFACPRCSARYNDRDDLTLKYTAHAPVVSRLTIGSVQVNTAGAWDAGVQYMAVETGVGSGSVYKEAELFDTEEDAFRCAAAMAKSADQSVGWVARQYDKSLEISDYQLESAALKKASDEKSRARSMLYGLGDLFETISEAPDKDAIIEAVEEYKRHDWSRDKAEAEAALAKASDGVA